MDDVDDVDPFDDLKAFVLEDLRDLINRLETETLSDDEEVRSRARLVVIDMCGDAIWRHFQLDGEMPIPLLSD